MKSMRKPQQSWARQHRLRADRPALLPQSHEEIVFLDCPRAERDVTPFARDDVPVAICRKQRRHPQAGTRPEDHLDPLMPQRAIA